MVGVTVRGALLALLLSTDVVVEDPATRLYGRAVTRDGAAVEGWLRWDRNEASWADVLDGLKEIPLEHVQEAERLDPEFAERQRRERSLVAFGVRLTWEVDDQSGPPTSAAGIRFGHLESLEIVDRSTARLRFRGGGEVVLRSSSTDLGRGMGDLVVERPGGGRTELGWEDLERVDFMTAPAGTAAPSSYRLHGTLTTWEGLELTGWVAWDLDEILSDDVLDGRADGDDFAIPFADIASIAWESDRSARVALRSGRELILRGTNDVDRDNRGIEVSDVGFGRAVVQWEDFREVRFHPPGARTAWVPTPPDRSIRGTVRARDGRAIEGDLRWGNDQERAWEMLEGWSADAQLDIEFGTIRTIERMDEEGVRVTLLDGRTFDLADSSDVDARNLGVFVQAEGRQRRLVRWRDLDRVELTW
jgi:hypothetical protein